MLSDDGIRDGLGGMKGVLYVVMRIYVPRNITIKIEVKD